MPAATFFDLLTELGRAAREEAATPEGPWVREWPPATLRELRVLVDLFFDPCFDLDPDPLLPLGIL